MVARAIGFESMMPSFERRRRKSAERLNSRLQHWIMSGSPRCRQILPKPWSRHLRPRLHGMQRPRSRESIGFIGSFLPNKPRPARNGSMMPAKCSHLERSVFVASTLQGSIARHSARLRLRKAQAEMWVKNAPDKSLQRTFDPPPALLPQSARRHIGTAFARRGHCVGGAYRQSLSVRPRTACLRVRPTVLRVAPK